MSKIILNKKRFKDKLYACWMGKNIGGTLGEKWECKKHTHALTFYDPMPDKASPNDDLDLQLVWLKMLEDKGIDPSVRTFAEYWEKYACRYPWNEYGFCMRNLSRGLLPPVAGCFENYYVDEMGSPIRSEIWACLHPGDPQAAARMAWKDSALDHAGGEGTYGEMFWSALQAAAFVESEPMTLIRIGLSMIPLSSHIARAVREAVWCYENGLNWGQARQKIVTIFGHHMSCNAVPNHGFTIIGWLYGEDFGDKMCKAVNCGYDTDCTAATLGATLGIINGTAGIPQKWIDPIGTEIVLHKFTGDCDAPKTIDQLTDRTLALAEKSLKKKRGFSFGEKDTLPKDLRTQLFTNQLAQKALTQDIHAAVEVCHGKEVWLHYNGEPVIRPGIGKMIVVTIDPSPSLKVNLLGPKGWKITRIGFNQFNVLANDNIDGRNKLTVKLNGDQLDFTILGPSEAQGFPAGVNVPECPKCTARVEACICENESNA